MTATPVDSRVDQWLVRTAQNEIRGPVTHAEILQQIERGEIALQDEVCRADGYWFYLHEGTETLAQLGIAPPHSTRAHGEEITQTDTDTETLMPETKKSAPKSSKLAKTGKSKPHVQVVGQELERVSYLKMLAFVGVVLIVFLVAGALRILWSS